MVMLYHETRHINKKTLKHLMHRRSLVLFLLDTTPEKMVDVHRSLLAAFRDLFANDLSLRMN